MDYEIGFRMLFSVVLAWFWLDKKNTREDIKALQEKVSTQGTKVEVIEEKIKAIKEDTGYIRRKIEGA